jgi:transposase-like protein
MGKKGSGTKIGAAARKKNTRRRRFTPEEKLRILAMADACRLRGELQALLKRESIRASHLAAWRVARIRGLLETLPPRRRGTERGNVDHSEEHLARLHAEVADLEKQAQSIEAHVQANRNTIRQNHSRPEFHQMDELMELIARLSPRLGVLSICNAIGFSRATYYRRLRRHGPKDAGPKREQRLHGAKRAHRRHRTAAT